MTTFPKSVVVAGALAQKPGRGGHTWVLLQYLLGFRKLGWDVVFIDSLDAGVCVDAAGMAAPVGESWNVRYADDVLRRFGLGDSYAILHDAGRASIGLPRAEVIARVRRSEALINVMGFLKDDEVLAAAPRRVFLDIDPGFGQMWQALGLHDTFRGHDAHVTIGENIGTPGCVVPTCDVSWITTKQPVVLDYWPAASVTGTMTGPVTTVATWRGAYGPIEYQGETYGLRAREFRRFAALPRRTEHPFTIALDIQSADAADKALLETNGWMAVDPVQAAGDPWRYRQFIQQSGAELMVAKGMYVGTQSGWFSDRSICYLASGKPVLAQDTGLRDVLPSGEGLLTFTTLDEAANGMQAIAGDYARHSRAARAMAEEVFDSSKVLRTLSERLSLC
jgi:hypothetical protein